jgi:hypothetical protein
MDFSSMKKISKEGWVIMRKPGDAGIILADNFFSTLQNWYRKKVDKVDDRASHAFIMKRTPAISEANGLYIKEANVTKYLADRKKVWIFRNLNMTTDKAEGILDYCSGAERNGGTYSLKGISQFGLSYFMSFFGKKIKFKDQQGSFCSEYLGKALINEGIPFLDGKVDFSATPSFVLDYLLGEKGKADQWILSAYYDGAGNYYIN